MKQDEKLLWEAALNNEWPRNAGERLSIPPKRVVYLCMKWTRLGKYEYGISADLGWVKRTVN